MSDIYAQAGKAALHRAAWNGHRETCQFLIDHGASVDAEDEVRDNTYHECALCKL